MNKFWNAPAWSMGKRSGYLKLIQNHKKLKPLQTMFLGQEIMEAWIMQEQHQGGSYNIFLCRIGNSLRSGSQANKNPGPGQ